MRGLIFILIFGSDQSNIQWVGWSIPVPPNMGVSFGKALKPSCCWWHTATLHGYRYTDVDLNGRIMPVFK